MKISTKRQLTATALAVTLLTLNLSVAEAAGAQGAFHIGDNGPAGGKVFYVSDAGLHGLEAAPEDQSTGEAWGCYDHSNYISVPGARGVVVGTGAANTAAIVAACAETNVAAKIADAYVLNGYTDWHLPSKDELNLLFQQRAVVGGFSDIGYWSSTEYSSNDAWIQTFFHGRQGGNYKNYILPVRAVRVF